MFSELTFAVLRGGPGDRQLSHTGELSNASSFTRLEEYRLAVDLSVDGELIESPYFVIVFSMRGFFARPLAVDGGELTGIAHASYLRGS